MLENNLNCYNSAAESFDKKIGSLSTITVTYWQQDFVLSELEKRRFNYNGRCSGGAKMIKALIFDMYETLITHYKSPLYFSEDMARDAGIQWEKFYGTWRSTDSQRTLGKLTFEAVIRQILEENNVWSQEKFDLIVEKRKATKRELFNHLHPQIIPMLKAAKEKGLKIALISNCFNEESEVIKNSVLAPYFDAACLSCELGICKPDLAIFNKCLDELGLKPEECIYCGDGGSSELEAASSLGMRTFQACWYFSPENEGILCRKPDFPQLENPMEIISKL